jgi:hypothetical protein
MSNFTLSSDSFYIAIGSSVSIMTSRKVKKGDRVVTTGYGRTKDWNNTVGTVSKRRGEKVFVVWENTSFHIEDEMDIKEVKPYEKIKKSSNLAFD